MAASLEAPLCPDWVFASNANVHIAKDRGWFKTYAPFQSTLDSSPFVSSSSGSLPVLGIGTVAIPTDPPANTSNTSSKGFLQLYQVLHVPDFVCNVVGRTIFDYGYNVIFHSSSKPKGVIKDKQGKGVAYFDPGSLNMAIKVRDVSAGPKLGPHVLQPNEPCAISCYWKPAQQQEWEKFKEDKSLTNSKRESKQLVDNPPYSPDEMAYLKEVWGSEYKFLVARGLKIHNEEHRAEGRLALRIMREEEEEEELAERFGDDYLDDDDGHDADHVFSSRQLEWVEDNYANSEYFMFCHDLHHSVPGDGKKAKDIVDEMIKWEIEAEDE